MLAKREHSKRELLRKLQQKGFETELINVVIAELEAENLQSEVRFCEMLIRSRIAKGYGKNRILNEIREHQLASDLVSHAFLEIDADWFDICQRMFDKRFRDGPASDWQGKQKQMRYLLNRGFSQEEIRAAMGE